MCSCKVNNTWINSIMMFSSINFLFCFHIDGFHLSSCILAKSGPPIIWWQVSNSMQCWMLILVWYLLHLRPYIYYEFRTYIIQDFHFLNHVVLRLWDSHPTSKIHLLDFAIWKWKWNLLGSGNQIKVLHHLQIIILLLCIVLLSI